MIEQSEVQTEAGVPGAAVGRALPEAVRASLQAVRVAQDAARLRARRETARARIWLATLVAAVAVAALAVGPRLARWRHARVQAAASARPVPVVKPVEPTAVAPAAAPVAPVATPVAPVAAPESSAAPLAPVAAGGEARGDAVAGAGCDIGLVRKTPWLLSPEACARAFEADSKDASLAMAIAHAAHVRGRFAEAAQWARRALALDPKRAEAYVLIARADAQAGRDEDARAAYRRYLQLAPRGWHKAEARTTLGEAR
jgi:tetratricopeptide (TPR) repeat protein